MFRPTALLAACASISLGACFLAPSGPGRRGPPPMGDPVQVPASNPTAVQMRGRVLDARGLPVGGLELLVVGGGHTGSRVRSDANGMFSAAGLPATDDGLVIVRDERFAPLVREGVALREREPASVSLRLDPALAIAGRVLDERGEPLAHAQVTVRGERKLLGRVRKGASVEAVAGIDHVETDGDGRFRFAGLYAGEFELVARWPFAEACSARSRVRGGDEAFELRFDAANLDRAFVVGVVRSGAGGAPRPGIDVCARPLSKSPTPAVAKAQPGAPAMPEAQPSADAHAASDVQAPTARATTRTDGTFVLGPLDPGEQLVTARSTNLRLVLPVGITRIELDLDSGSGGAR